MYLKLAAIVVATALVSGCNTMQGAGEDLKAGKNKLENSFSKHKRESTESTTTPPGPTSPTGPNPSMTAPTGSPDSQGMGGPAAVAPGTEPGTTPNSQ